MGASNIDVGERFQRSGETISRAFHEVLEAISGRSRGYQGLARDIIRSNDPTFQAISSYITNDARYMPYFKPRHFPCSSLGISDTMPQANLVEGTDRQRSKRTASVTSFSGGVKTGGSNSRPSKRRASRRLST
nr:putative nuclease HARBI1 [Ipomoea batatas]